MMVRLARAAVESDANLLWNSFIDLIARAPAELEPEQRAAHFAFVYESEVQNGGHLQYFENRGTERIAETIEALNLIGAQCHEKVLRAAGETFLQKTREPFRAVEEYAEAALEGEFDALDGQFHRCSPSLLERLERFFEEHRAWFIEIVPA
jgi:hypothetical protein